MFRLSLGKQNQNCDGISRRHVLCMGTCGLISGLTLPRLLELQAKAAGENAKTKSCISLFLYGGPPHQDMWDPKPDAPPEIRGPFEQIKTNVPGTFVTDQLPLCAKMADKYTILRSHSHRDNGHTTGYHYVMTGRRANFPDGDNPVPNNDFYPSIGSAVSRVLGQRAALPPYINLPHPIAGGGPGFYGAEHAPFVIEADPTQPDFKVKDLQPVGRLSEKRRNLRKRLLSGIDQLERERNPQMYRKCVAIAAILMAFLLGHTRSLAAETINFDEQIAPLIAHRCLECHNSFHLEGGLLLSQKQSAFNGGESGTAIVAEQPNDSLLWQRVADNEMPPNQPLPDKEKELIRKWIAAGAKWGTDPIDAFRYTTDKRAGYDWWSLQPVQSPEVPEVANQAWLRNHVDPFVLSKLNNNNLSPSDEADRRTLIRRLYFDLLGLPPTQAQTHEFINDHGPDAYGRLADRLLASPHYGIRWGRHWLDIVRFGESQGFERDYLRPNSWPYRDWVIDSLNGDMPYDEFTRQQLAGDVLEPGKVSSTIATGFLVAGAWDQVGNAQKSQAMKRVVRQDELEDITGAVGQTFLGLTVNCARCHDHKFDPVRQKEYYQLTAALAGVRHGEREVVSSEGKKRSAEIMAQINALRGQVLQLDNNIRRRILEKRKDDSASRPIPPAPIASWNFNNDLKDSVGKLHGKLQGKAKLDGGVLLVDGKDSYVITEALEQDLHEKTIEAWVKLDNLEQSGGGVISVEMGDNRPFDAIVYGQREPRRWMAGSNGFLRTQSFNGYEEKEASKYFVHMAIVYQNDGTIISYRNGQPYGAPYKSNGPITFKAGQTRILFGRRQPIGDNRMLAGQIDAAKLYNRALTPKEIEASATDSITSNQLLAEMTEREQSKRKELDQSITGLFAERSLLPRIIYVNTPRQPEPSHLLHRGNPADKREVVAAGGVSSVTGVDADFGVEANAAEADRRKQLSAWIANRHNPLFTRVIVNRLWHYHFGTGLVDTPSDFGFNGGRPSHPQLIDHLASELVRSGFSLKHVHRLIVTSATYRQSSHYREEAYRIDAGNRLLWRKNPKRLEAEALRDSMLLITDQLNQQMGGPGYRDFDTFKSNSQFYVMKDFDGPQFNRRSVYRTWIRSGRSPFLDAFDCPDPSTKTPKRAVTTTPLQALALMNNAFAMRMSERFASRVKAESGDAIARQIRLAFQIIYSREPAYDELDATEQFVEDHGLASLCRVLLNSNEFLYSD